MGNGLELILFANVSLVTYEHMLTLMFFFSAIQVDCGDPGTPVNGRRKLTTTFEGDIVEYFCSTGFDLEGDQERKCQSNGLWTGQLPICRQIS